MVRISTCMRMDVISMSMKNWFLMMMVMMVVAGMRVHHVAMMVHIIFRTFRMDWFRLRNVKFFHSFRRKLYYFWFIHFSWLFWFWCWDINYFRFSFFNMGWFWFSNNFWFWVWSNFWFRLSNNDWFRLSNYFWFSCKRLCCLICGKGFFHRYALYSSDENCRDKWSFHLELENDFKNWKIRAISKT